MLQTPSGFLSAENESLVLRTSLALTALALGQFKTTLSDDLELLARDPSVGPSGDARLAVVFRANKKRLLAETAARITTRLQGMMKPKEDPPQAPGGGAAGAGGGGGEEGAAAAATGSGGGSSWQAAPAAAQQAPRKAKGFGGGGGGGGGGTKKAAGR